MKKILLLSILVFSEMVGYSQNTTKKINQSIENNTKKYYDSTFIIYCSSGGSFNSPDFLLKVRESDTIYYQQFKIPSNDIIKIKSNNMSINNIRFNKILGGRFD